MSRQKLSRWSRRLLAHSLTAVMLLSLILSGGLPFPARAAAEDWSRRVSLVFDEQDFKPDGGTVAFQWHDLSDTQRNWPGYDGIALVHNMYGKNGPASDYNVNVEYGYQTDVNGVTKYGFEAGRPDSWRDGNDNGNKKYTMTMMMLEEALRGDDPAEFNWEPGFNEIWRDYEVTVTYYDGDFVPNSDPSQGHEDRTGKGFYLSRQRLPNKGTDLPYVELTGSGEWRTVTFGFTSSAFNFGGYWDNGKMSEMEQGADFMYNLALIAETPVWIHSVVVERASGWDGKALLRKQYNEYLERLYQGQGSYTGDVWGAFASAMDSAYAVLNNEDITSRDDSRYASELAALKAAFGGLKTRWSDRVSLTYHPNLFPANDSENMGTAWPGYDGIEVTSQLWCSGGVYGAEYKDVYALIAGTPEGRGRHDRPFTITTLNLTEDFWLGGEPGGLTMTVRYAVPTGSAPEMRVYTSNYDKLLSAGTQDQEFFAPEGGLICDGEWHDAVYHITGLTRGGTIMEKDLSVFASDLIYIHSVTIEKDSEQPPADPSSVNPGSGGDWANRVDVTFSQNAQNKVDASHPEYDGITIDPSVWSGDGGMENAAEISSGKWAYQAGLKKHQDAGRALDLLFMKLDPLFINNPALKSSDVKVTVNYFDGDPDPSYTDWDGNAFAVAYNSDFGGPYHPGSSNPGRAALTGSGVWKNHEVIIPAGELFYQYADDAKGFWPGYFMSGDGWCMGLHAAQPVWIHSITLKILGGASADPLEALKNTYNQYKDVQKGNYTDESWSAFMAALAEAQALIDSGSADEAAINAAIANLIGAYGGLRIPAGDYGERVSLIFSPTFSPSGYWGGVEIWDQENTAGFGGIAVAPQMYGKNGGGNNETPVYDTIDGKYALEAGRRDAVRDGTSPYTMTALKLHPDFKSNVALGEDPLTVTVTYFDGQTGSAAGTGQGFYLWWNEGQDIGGKRVKIGSSNTWKTAEFTVTPGSFGQAGWGYDIILAAEDPVWIHSITVEKAGASLSARERLQREFNKYAAAWNNGAGGASYSAASWNEFDTRMTLAQGLLVSGPADEDDDAYAIARENLAAAYGGLTFSARKLLNDAVSGLGAKYDGGAGNNGGLYSAETWASFASAMTDAIALLESEKDKDDPLFVTARLALSAANDNLERVGRLEGAIRYDVPESDGITLTYGDDLSPQTAPGTGFEDIGALITTAGGAWGGAHLRLFLDERFPRGETNTYVITVEYYTSLSMDGAFGVAYRGGGWSAYQAVTGGAWRTLNLTTDLNPDPGDDGFIGTLELKAYPFHIRSITVRMLFGDEDPPPADPRSAREKLQDQYNEYLPRLNAGNLDATWTASSWEAFSTAMTATKALLDSTVISDDDDPQFDSLRSSLVAAYGLMKRSNPLTSGSVTYVNNGGVISESRNGVWLDFNRSESPNSALGVGYDGAGALITGQNGGSLGNTHIAVMLDPDFHTGKKESFLVRLEYYTTKTQSDAIGIAHRGGWSAYGSAETGKWSTAYILVEQVSWPEDDYVFLLELKVAPIQIHSVTVELLTGTAEPELPEYFGDNPNASWADEVSLYWDENGNLQRDGLAYSDYANVVKYVPMEMKPGQWGAKTIPMGGVTGSEPGSLSYAMFLNVAPMFKDSDPPVIEVDVEFWDAPRSSRTPLGGSGYGPDDRKFGFFIGFVNKDKIGTGQPDQYPFGTSIVATGTEEWRIETIRLENINLGRQHMGSAYGDYFRYNMALYIQEGMIIRSITVRKPKEVTISTIKDDVNPKPYLFYAGERIELPVALTNGTGALEGAATAEVALYNYDNILVARTSASIELEAGQKKTAVPMFAPGSVPKGSYFVEFTARDSNGNAYGTVKDYLTVVQGLEDLSEAGIIDIDSFGVATHFIWYGNDDPKNDHEMMVAIEVMKAAGITTVRDEYTWFEVEPGNMSQNYSFTHDRWISLMVENGITPLICLDYGHDYWGWDPVNGTETSGKHGAKFEQFPKAGYPLANNPYLDPSLAGKTYIEACGDYAYALVSHLANSSDPNLRKVQYFEIWNEPNLHTGADVFFPVQKVIYERVKEANPNAVVMAAAVCMFDEAFIWRLLDLGGYDYMDAFSYHYPDHPRGRIITSTVKIQEYIKEVSKRQMPEKYPDGKDMTVWITEMGDSSYRISNTLLAAQYAQYYVEHRAYFNESLNESVYLYVLQNYTTLDAVTHQVQSHGLSYREGPYAPKPMIASLNAAAWLTRATRPGERYDGLRFSDRNGNPVRTDLESPALVDGKPVRVYTFYATEESVRTSHAAGNVGDQIIAIYSYDGAVPVSVYVGDDFILYDGYGNVVNVQALNGVLALTLTEMPYYIVLPAAKALNPVVLGEGLFTTASGIRYIAAGSIMEIDVSRTGQARGLSGFYTAGLINGWTLVDENGDSVDKLPFGPGASDIVRVRLPGNAEIGNVSKIFIHAEDGEGTRYAEMTVECSVLPPISVETYPVIRDGGALGVEVKITNNRNTTLPAGSMTVSQPADAGVLNYDAIPAGGSATMSFADPRLNKDSLVPFAATLTVDGATESISRNLSGLGANPVTDVAYDPGSKYKPDWNSIDWERAEPFYPDYDNYVNKKDGGNPPREWGGKDDLDFTGKTLYDNRYLYVMVDVTDDQHILTGDVNNSWAQDSLQISIDPMRGPGSARDQYGIPQAAGYRGEISIIAALFPATGHYGMAIQYNTVPGLDARNLQDSHIYAVRDEASGKTTYMLALDWRDILTAEQLAGGFNPGDTHLGFAVTVNDIDQGTARGWMNYMDGIAYGKDVRKFGDLILSGKDDETPDDPAPVKVTVTTPTIVETLAANLRIYVEGESLDGLTAYLVVDGVEKYPTPVVNGTAYMHIDEAPEFGTPCKVVVRSDGAYGELEMALAKYNPGELWAPGVNIDSGGTGKLLITFSETITHKTGGKIAVTVGGISYGCSITSDGKGLLIDIDYAGMAQDASIVASGVKYPDLFPSYSFTFTMYKSK